MTNRATLAEYLDEMPVDGPTGQPLISSDGRPDQPEDYQVLKFVRTDDGFRALVVGPSGQTDLVVDDGTGTRIYRDCDDIDA